MSPDTTVVVAAYANPFNGERSYTAAYVQAAEDLFGDHQALALGRAKSVFFQHGLPWFSSLGRAKRFATLLAEDLREKGGLDSQNRLIIEIGKDRVYRLSRRGNRLEDRPKSEEDSFPLNDWVDPSSYLGPDDYFDESGRITNG